MMTKEQHFFIQILSDYLAGRKTAPVPDIQWNPILSYAQTQQVGGIVFYQCKDVLPEQVRPTLEKAYSASVYYYLNRIADLSALDAAFRAANIEYFTVKGVIVASYYPVPELRTMGDADIVIHSDDREKSNEIMTGLGYQGSFHGNDREWHYSKRGLEYEVHDTLAHSFVYAPTPADEFINNFWPYVKDNKMDPSFHFVFVLKHLMGHFRHSGVGFRQFMDVAVMAKNEKNLNWPWIQETLEKLGMLEFARTCFGFIKRWFGISVPCEILVPDDAFYESSTETIFTNGVFGYDNDENKKNAVVNEMRSSGQSREAAMAGKAVRYIFPSYKRLCSSEVYSYLKGRPYLLPAAYVHHFARGIKNFNNSKKTMANNFATKEEIARRDEYLKKWGL